MSSDRDGLAGRPSEVSTSYLEQAFTAVSPSDMPRADCPPSGKIWESVRGELAPAAFREVVRHVAGCPICTEAWRVAETLEQSYEDDHKSVLRFPRSWAAGVVAAAAAVVLAIGVQNHKGGGAFVSAKVASVRGGSDSVEIMMLNQESCQRENCVLNWQGPEGTEYYKLEVYPAAEPQKRLVRERRLETPEYLVPAAVLAELPPGATLLVYLEAVHPTEQPRPLEDEVVVQ